MKEKNSQIPIPVIFAINNTYVKQLATVLVSILKNSNSKNIYKFYVLNSDITNKNLEILTDIVKKHNKKSEINFIDMNNILKDFNLEDYMSRRENYTYISIETYFRFFIPELFPQYNKVIYLDADILVMQDLKNLFDINIKNAYAGVVQDNWQILSYNHKEHKPAGNMYKDFKEYYQKKLKKTNSKYFNAGVLLLNLDEIRKDNIVQKLWDFTANESPLEFQDQDVLNAVLEPKLKYIDNKWNVLKDLAWLITQYSCDKITKQNYKKTLKKTAIFHYVGSNKPWVIHNSDYEYIKDWWKYYKQTPYFQYRELSILKNINYLSKAFVYKSYFTLRVLNFTILDIYQQDAKLKFKIFEKLKISIKFIVPKRYTNIESI